MKPLNAVIAVILFILLIILPVTLLFNISQTKFEENKQMKWLAIVLMIPVIGCFIYLIWGKKDKLKNPS
jgi:hypothetical protein